MATTVRIELDADLVARLRRQHPGVSDRQMLERLAEIELGRSALLASQRRNALDGDEALEQAVEAVHAARAHK